MTTKHYKDNVPAHFIGSADCKFARTSTVGPWLISTVGDYRPPYDKGRQQSIGYNRNYETMVFPWSGKVCEVEGCGCGVPIADKYEDHDMSGYRTEPEAILGHEAMVRKYEVPS